MLHEYHLDHWRVLIDPAALVTRVEPQIQAIIFPETPVLFEKALYLLSHELESHTLRYVAGERSALALLGIGTKGYLATEEGLALYADVMTARAQHPRRQENIPWMGTFAVGLACGARLSSGVKIRAHSFHVLFRFLEQYFLLAGVLNGAAPTIEAARERARTLALTRCLRTFRGVPDLTHRGICSAKDNCYVQGYLAIKDAIAQQGEDVLTHLFRSLVREFAIGLQQHLLRLIDPHNGPTAVQDQGPVFAGATSGIQDLTSRWAKGQKMVEKRPMRSVDMAPMLVIGARVKRVVAYF